MVLLPVSGSQWVSPRPPRRKIRKLRSENSSYQQQLSDCYRSSDWIYPIFQAATGSTSSPDLAIAVSSAGAMGGMALWRFPPDEASARVAKVRSAIKQALLCELRSGP